MGPPCSAALCTNSTLVRAGCSSLYSRLPRPNRLSSASRRIVGSLFCGRENSAARVVDYMSARHSIPRKIAPEKASETLDMHRHEEAYPGQNAADAHPQGSGSAPRAPRRHTSHQARPLTRQKAPEAAASAGQALLPAGGRGHPTSLPEESRRKSLGWLRGLPSSNRALWAPSPQSDPKR